MFTLTDGRDYLYQWDINRSVRVSDPSVTEVHFCNKTGDCSLVTKVYANPTDSELYADIPNILLQSPFDIRVFAYCDCYTKVEETFKVKARSKPDDYVYTETEILQYSNIVERMDKLEDSLSENLEETVNNYLEEHPVQVDLTGYAKEEYVDTAISNIKFPEPDLTNYATKDYVTDQIDYYTEDFATTGYVDDKIAEIGEPDLTGYATERWVNNQGFLKTVPAQYVTEDELSAKGYAKQNDLSIYAKKTDIPTVPTKVSELQNDKGYLTEHQSLDGYATTSYVDDAVSNIPGAYITLSTTGMSEKYAAATDVQIDFIESLLANPLQPIFVRHEGDSYPCLLNSLGGNIWEIRPCENAANLTMDRSLYNTFAIVYKKTSGTWEAYCRRDKVLLATTGYVDEAIANIEVSGGGDVDLSNYYTKDETYSRTEVDNAIANAGGSGGGSGTTDSFFLDFHNATTSWTDADAEMIAFAEYYWNNSYSACAQIRDTHDELFYPSIIQAVDSTSYNFLKASINLNTVASNQPIEWDIIRLEKRSGVWKYCILAANSYVFGSADLTNYYTKAEINSLFEGIAIAEERSY